MMEPDVSWVPCDFEIAHYWSMNPADEIQLAHWTMDMEPAAGFPVASAPAEIVYGSSCLQTYVPARSTVGQGQHQLVEFSSETPTQNDQMEIFAAQDGQFQVDFHKNPTNPIPVFENAAREFKDEVDIAKIKTHRYPARIRSLGELYTIPMTVAIGPYHYGRDHLKPAEKVKHVAAYHCILQSGRSAEDVYAAVVSVVGHARRLYDRNVVDAIGDDVFLPMMFYDACYLVQYMINCTDAHMHMDPALRSFFDANDQDVFQDIMQIENQLPWPVVRAVLAFRPVPLNEFVASLRCCLQDRKDRDEKPFVLDDGFEPPHRLGLLRYYIVGRSHVKLPALPETETMSFSVSAIELAEIGITLTASKATTQLVHMGGHQKGNLFAELAMAPLSLDDTRASLLLNIAALELCATSSFHDADDEASAVCSYLLLLGMLVDREEDVHELRARRVLQGGGGLTNGEALRFLTSIQGIRLGSRYVRTMEEIQDYKVKRGTRTKVHAFVYRNIKLIVAVISAVAALVSIIGTIRSLGPR